VCRLVLLGANPRHLESRVGGIVVRVSSEQGGGGWLAKPPLVFQAREVGAAGCESPLSLAFRAREVVVVGKNPLRHSNREWEGGSWQAKPPTRKSSEGGGGDGLESSPSLVIQVGGWLLAGKASHSHFE
jgi:hypothetical protein